MTKQMKVIWIIVMLLLIVGLVMLVLSLAGKTEGNWALTVALLCNAVNMILITTQNRKRK